MIRLYLILLLPVLLLAPLLAALRYCWAILTNPPRAWRIAIGYDQLGNVAANGDEDETISSRAGKARRKGKRWGCVLCKLLEKIDPGHCDRAIEEDEGN